MVLEISATPYIFTFKLWDWGRVGLDGIPRPVHIEHGLKNIQWERTTPWIEENLIHQDEIVSAKKGCLVEKTGLQVREPHRYLPLFPGKSLYRFLWGLRERGKPCGGKKRLH